jgi:hypothetical protein
MSNQINRTPFAQRIDNFWTAFAQQVSRSPEDVQTIPLWLNEQINLLQKGLSWDVGPWNSGKYNLAITCEDRYQLRPLVDEIIRKAPVLNGWTYSATRPPIPNEMVANVFQSRTGKALPACTVSCAPADFNFIDVEFRLSPNAQKVSQKELFALLEVILGEEFLQVWIGDIRFEKKFFGNIFGTKFQPIQLSDFRARSENLANSMLESSTPTTFYFEQAKPERGALVNLLGHPEMSSIDRLTSNTFHPSITKATLAKRFWSKRYSRRGETFCYLKIDASYDVAQRNEVENGLDEFLRNRKLGCVWGGGSGLKSTFIDLVFPDFDNSLPSLNDYLASKNISAHVCFYDLSYQNVKIPVP